MQDLFNCTYLLDGDKMVVGLVGGALIQTLEEREEWDFCTTQHFGDAVLPFNPPVGTDSCCELHGHPGPGPVLP